MNPDLCSIKIEEIRANDKLKESMPDMPVAIMLQEAVNLYDWYCNDKEVLANKGMNWKLAEEIPLRAEALRRLETCWISEKMSSKDCMKEWKAILPQALALKKELLFHFRFIFKDNPEVYLQVQLVSAGTGLADMIQDLADLSAIGKKNKEEIKNKDFDLSLLDKAMDMSFKLGPLLARNHISVKEKSEKQILRNKAFYHLRESMDIVRITGQYAFRLDKERIRGYYSSFVHRKNQKYRKTNN